MALLSTMVGPLLVFIGFQAPPLVRDLSPGKQHRYRVEIEGSGGEELRYRMRLKTMKPGEKETGPQMDLLLMDYRATIDGRTVSTERAGGGLLPISATGLPNAFGVSGRQGSLWLPLFALYLPSAVEAGLFTIGEVVLADGAKLGGKGRCEGRRVTFDGSLSREEKPYATLHLETTFDEGGWPLKSEGALVDASGTTRFKLSKG